MSQNILLGKCVLVQMSSCSNSGTSFVPSSLTEIFRFDEMLRTTVRHNPGHKLVICTNVGAYVQTKTVFLTGCHLMMTHSFTFRQTFEAFKHLKGLLPSFDETQLTSLPCCWMALYRAKCLGWVDFGDIFDIGPADSIFIEEYIHYARQVHPPVTCHPYPSLVHNRDPLAARSTAPSSLWCLATSSSSARRGMTSPAAACGSTSMGAATSAPPSTPTCCRI
jgi:hypothetical protein